MESLLQKLRDGTITAEELARLKELAKKNGYQFSNDELKSIHDNEKRLGLL